MYLLKNQDALGLRGEYRIVRVNFWPEIKSAVAHIDKMKRRQIGQVDPEETRRILASVCPCWEMEHRMGVCPLGLSHATQDREGHNTITTALKKSVIDQLVGNGSPTSLLISRIATGTSSAATDVSQTTLFAETYRDIPTYLAPASSTQAQAFWYFPTTVANAGSMLQEWGIFGGGATSTANSGVLLARFLNPFDKNSGSAASGSYALSTT